MRVFLVMERMYNTLKWVCRVVECSVVENLCLQMSVFHIVPLFEQ